MARTESLGAQIQKARARRRMSMGDVERRSGGRLTTGGISRLEAGQRQPGLPTLEALSEVLDVRIVISKGKTRLLLNPEPPKQRKGVEADGK